MSDESRPPRLPTTDMPATVLDVLNRFRAAWASRTLDGPAPDPEVWAAGLIGPDREHFAREATALAAELAGRETVDLPAAADPARSTGTFGTNDSGAPGTASESRGRVQPTNRLGGYEVLGELGAGGMGVVYKARQVALDRTVALKMVIGGGRASSSQIARFKSEALAVARLDHPNIVQVYDIGEHDGLQYFAMEYVDGGSLDKKLNRQPMEPQPAADLARTLARAMHYAHQKGVIHRDLKPANVLLSGELRAVSGEPDKPSSLTAHRSWLTAVKITDFGLAKLANDASGGQTRTGAVMGTPNYMAPEQAEGHTRDVTHLADVYALGATLYEVLTGRPPFQGPSVVAILAQVRSHEPVSPAELQPALPRDLETICLKCLQKEPAKRYATAGELAADLDRFLDGRPILARPISSTEMFVRWCRKNKTIAKWAFMAAGLAVALLTSLIVYSVVLKGKNDRIASQALAIELANGELVTANAAIKVERDAARRLSDLNAEQVRYLMRKLATDLKYLGLTRQRQELVKYILDQVDRFERLSTEGAGIVERGKVSGWTQLGELFTEMAQSDRDGQAAHLARAEEYFTRAAELARQIADRDPGSDLARGNLALVLTRRGDVALLRGALPEAEELFDEGYQLRKQITDNPKSQAGTTDYLYPANRLASLAEAHDRLAKLARAKNDLPAARQQEKECLKLREEVLKQVAADPKTTDEPGGDRSFVLALADSYIREAVEAGTARPRADLAAAEKYLTEALKLSERAVVNNDQDPATQRRLAAVIFRLGVNKLSSNQAAPAQDLFERAAGVVQQILGQGDEKTSAANRGLYAQMLYGLGVAQQKLGDRTRAIATFKECTTIRQRLYDEDDTPQHAWYLMVALARAGHHARAVKELRAEQDRQDEAARKPQAQNFWYNAACTYSLAADAVGNWKPDDQLTAAERKLRGEYTDAGLDAIRRLIEMKSQRVSTLPTDPDLEYLQKLPAFRELLPKG